MILIVPHERWPLQAVTNEDIGIGLQRPIAARAKVLDRQVSSQAQRMVQSRPKLVANVMLRRQRKGYHTNSSGSWPVRCISHIASGAEPHKRALRNERSLLINCLWPLRLAAGLLLS